MLNAKGIVKRYDKKLAVSDISFQINDGEVYGLLGPNGAGKSTTINVISGLIKKDAGEIIIGGKNLDKNLLECKMMLGIVPQELAIYNDLSAEQNVSFFGSLYNLSGKKLEEQTKETLDYVGLYDRRKEKVKTFSGGMKRRLNIACGLVHRPKLLILDEPTVGIDPQSRNHIMESILRLNSEGMTILYTTHYMEEAEQLCNRIAIMDEGQIVAQGTLQELRQIIEEHWFIKMRLMGDVPMDELRLIDGIEQIDIKDFNYRFSCKQKKNQLRDLLDTLIHHHVEISDMSIDEADLEDIFLALTGKSLRD
ncbi:MAG TPA: ABC transporter ATP-binding protein [Christensenellaceae bacterium]|jgi:ABC-2 type transport system ATP-binding protein|nr:ABC transporter ATP-binding protein [Christensenellaceae bacterium]